MAYHSEYNSGSILSRQYNPIRSNTAVNSAWFHAPGKVLQETLVDQDLALLAHRERIWRYPIHLIPLAAIRSNYISPAQGERLCQAATTRKKTWQSGLHAQLGRLLLAGVSSPACLACLLALASIEDRERAKSGGRDLRIISTKLNEEKYKVYIPTSPQEFYKFILSIHPLARKKGAGGTNQTERLTCALRAVQAKKRDHSS